MTPQRKEYLYHQYVTPIVNDGSWYRKAKPEFDNGDVPGFLDSIRPFYVELRTALGDDVSARERAFIYMDIWAYYGGDLDELADQCPWDGIQNEMYELLRQRSKQPQANKETPVNSTNNSVAFETRHYVYGMDVANMNSGQLIEAIKRIEAEINDLKSVKAKSEHVKKRIAELEGMLAKVVEVLDAK